MKCLKKIITMIICLSLMVTVLSDKTVFAKSEIIPNDETGIPDKGLYQAILWKLDKKSTGKFTKKEAASVYWLDTAGFEEENKIKTLKGIENLTNLCALEIYENRLTSLKGVENLKDLERLKIGKGKLKNINEIKGLSKLTSLSISGNQLEDWTLVSNLTNLENLTIDNCGLTNSSLKKITSKLTKLTSLQIRGNKLTSLPGIEKLTKLESLDVTNNKITNLSGIENLTKLDLLWASNNRLKKLPSLKKLTNVSLEYFDLMGNKISEKEFKKKLPKHALRTKWWVKNQILCQKLKKKLKVNKVKKIKVTTNKITGKTEKKARVILSTVKGEKIKKVKANKKGIFILDTLDLQAYGGKKLKITAYLPYDDQINGEYGLVKLRTVKFAVH